MGSDNPAGSVPAYSGSGGALSSLQFTAGGPGENLSKTSHSSTEGFYLISQPESGSFAVTAQDTGETQNGSSYDNLGLTLRNGTGSLKANYSIYILGTVSTTSQGAIFVDYTAADGGSPVNLAAIPLVGGVSPGAGAAATCSGGSSASCYLGIDRQALPDGSGEAVTAYWSADGSHWSAIWGSTVVLHSGDALYGTGNVGVAGTSNSNTHSVTANLASVNLTSAPLLDEVPGAECPPNFQCAPVGSLAARGQWATPSNAWAANPWLIAGAGTGLYAGSTSDQLQWIYQPMNGDGSASAQVGAGYEFPRPSGEYGVSQYGVMVRASNSASDPYFAAFVSPCQGLGISYRTSAGGTSTLTYKSTPPDCTNSSNEYNGLGTSASISVMVKRTGTSYQAYYNSGSGWTSYLSSQTISAIPSQSPAGPFATSTISNWQAWANFSSVLISSDAPSPQELLGSGSPTEVVSASSGFTGNFVQSSSDLAMSGRGLPLGFSRTYNSLLGSEATTTLAPYGDLGPGWTDNYNQYTTKDSAGNITVQQGNGSAVTFAYNGSTYAPPTRVLATLVANTGQTLAPNCPATALVMTTHNQTKHAFYQITGSPLSGQPSGALCEMLDINGYPTELTYNTADTQLTTVTECTTVSGTTCGTSRTFTLAYADSSYPNSITSVTPSANAGTGTLKVTFTYNSSGQLITSADADGNTTYYAYNTEGLLNQIQTPKEHSASAPGELIWYDTSGRVRYTQDAAAKAAGLSAVSSASYQCNYVYGTDTCSTDGTQTSTTVDANGNETQDVYVEGLMTSDTQGVGSSVAATRNETFDQNTLGTATTTTPANGSGASYTISYTNWFGTGTYLGGVQCTVSPGNPGATVNETGASSSGGTATLTFGSTTAPIIGATIVVSGVTNTAYDGTFQVTGATTTSVSYAVSGSPGSSSGGSFYQIQGDATSFTYNSTYPNLVATTTNPLEQAVSYNGACNTGTPTYTTTNYYGASNGTCNQTGLAAWLLACTVVQTGGSPASATTTYTYDGGTDTNVGDITTTQDANLNNTVVTYDNYGDVLTSTKSGLSSDQCGTCGGTNATTNTYEPDGQIASAEEPDSAMSGTAAQWTTNTTYDAAGNQISQTDPGTTLTTTTPSSCTSSVTTLTLTNPNSIPAYPANAWIVVSGVTPSGYNGTFQVVSSTGTTVTYDETCPGAYTGSGTVVIESVNTYDGDNNVTSAADFRGATTNTTFDYDDRQLTVSDPASGGLASSQTYDSVGNQLTSTAYGAVTTVTNSQYDALNRQTVQTTPMFSEKLTNATCGSSQVTITFPAAKAPTNASTIAVSGVSPSGYNGSYSIVSSTGTTIKYNVTSCPGSYVSGGNVTSGTGMDGVTNASWSSGSGGQATLSFATGSPKPVTGAYIVVSGVGPSGYNGTFAVVSSTATSVTYSLSSSPGSYGSGGAIVPASYTAYYPSGATNYTIDPSAAGQTAASETYTTYFPGGQQNSVTSGYGQTGATSETYTYDAAGNTLTDDSAGATTTNTYNDVNWVLTSADQLGNVTTKTYDALGNVITESDPGTTITGTGGSWASNVATLTFAAGPPTPPVDGYVAITGVTPSQYDGTFQITGSSSTSVSYSVPLGSNPGTASAGTIGEPTVTQNYYDGANRLSYSCVNGAPSGNTCGTDPTMNGTNQVANVYDNDGNAYTGSDASSSTTTGGSPNPWKSTNQINVGGTDQTAKQTAPGAATPTTSTYNPDGSVHATTNPDTNTVTNTYDSSGNLTNVSNPNVSYSYNPDSTVSQMTDGTGTTSYAYDSQGNLASETDGAGQEMQYTWDAAGNLATITYPDTTVVTYTYDSQNRMISMNDGHSNTTNFAYDSNGNLSTVTPPNGTVTTYTYNSNDQLYKIATTKSGALFSFDASASGAITPSGNVQNVTTSQSAALSLLPGASGSPGTDAYSYDPLSRLTNDAQTGTGNVTSTLAYADNGEIHNVTAGGTIDHGAYVYPSLTGTDPGTVKTIGAGLAFDYNANGDRTCQGTAAPCSTHTTFTYTYDEANQLTKQADTLNESTAFTYDGNGLLQETLDKVPSGGTCPNIVQRHAQIHRHVVRRHLAFCTYETDLTWNTAMGTPTLAVSHDYATGVDEGYTDYIMGPQGLPIEDLVFGTGTPQWYYQDIQGNTRVLLNSTGGLIGSQNYPPFGVATSSWNGGTLGTPLQYNGAYSDGWTGFVYDQARWYDPGTGQFLSQDPLVDQTLQAYTYGADNPGGNNDTSGLSKRKGRMKTKFHVCANDYGDPNQGSNSTNMPNEWKAALCVNISYFHGGVQFHYNTGLTYYLNCWNGGDPTATCDYKDARVNQGWIRGHKIVEDSQPAYYTDFVVTWHFTILLTIEAWANGGVKKQATTQLQGGYPGPVPLPFL